MNELCLKMLLCSQVIFLLWSGVSILVDHFLIFYICIFGTTILIRFQMVVLGALIHVIYLVIVYILSKAI